MSARKTARVAYTKSLSPILQIVRIAPEKGSQFPEYKAGQHIALSRGHCKLTKKIIDEQGRKSYVYELDETGEPKRGEVTHAYSIASAPYETALYGYLEFYIALEVIEQGKFGRLTESLFMLEPEANDNIQYMNKIVGDFRLAKRGGGFKNIVMLGTGTGVAPFVSMLKQLHFEKSRGIQHHFSLTLFHANRTVEELGYHIELQAIEAAKKLDFVYVPSVSRPIARDFNDPKLGIGRANNILRLLFDLPMKEEEYLLSSEGDKATKELLLKNAVKPQLPSHLSKERLLERMKPAETVILTCGNPLLMDDVQYVAKRVGVRVEREEW